MRNPFTPRAEPALVRARVGVFGYFATSGFVMGTWAAGLPAVDERLHLGPGRLGTALLLIAGGALVSMLVVGRVSDRFTSRVVARISGPVAALLLLGPVLAPSYSWLLICSAVYGISVGFIEVSMNVNSIEVEVRYGRPIVSAFHGLWSLGGAAGGALTTAGLHAHLDPQAMLIGFILLSTVAFGYFGRMLLPPPSRPEPDPATAGAKPGRGLGIGMGIVLLLGIVAFGGHLAEGAAIDWAAIHARRVLDTPLSNAPIAYTVFGTAMTLVRLAGDPIRSRLGPGRTLLLAGVLSTAGYGLVLLSPVAGGAGLVVACVGWALTGMGLATVVPVVFSAIGAAHGAVGKALSLVTVFGSAGLLVGPAVIGHLAEATSLPTALIVPAVLAAVVALAGPSAIKALGLGRTTRPAEPVAEPV
ncbi:MFS transporter [Stackebrandtia nassauensis]|uniref:Major facilitator superfamily MFS_1 n=1 Tax=Stackebrandtia nassauensis (strain DSM 44728 / CIP 108903 / NRRL B-16338 / NBRC 102104 / LLR-40K-21) TaxID=446470 RepID=D3QAH2_STANL|nr:MFS transporter [Stackebrandtia nassauensis]ADD42755.1 major facilitator superfamily MFS_1 [Stackebrandtia nassauensis DSM 44728]